MPETSSTRLERLVRTLAQQAGAAEGLEHPHRGQLQRPGSRRVELGGDGERGALPVVDGRVVPTVNEVNTMPGLTALSQFPQMWQAAGIPYGELLELLLRTALRTTTNLVQA